MVPNGTNELLLNSTQHLGSSEPRRGLPRPRWRLRPPLPSRPNPRPTARHFRRPRPQQLHQRRPSFQPARFHPPSAPSDNPILQRPHGRSQPFNLRSEARSPRNLRPGRPNRSARGRTEPARAAEPGARSLPLADRRPQPGEPRQLAEIRRDPRAGDPAIHQRTSRPREPPRPPRRLGIHPAHPAAKCGAQGEHSP